jgi:hypothetical protein
MRAADRSKSLRGIGVFVLTIGAGITTVACDPCSTTVGCTQAPATTLVGQLLNDNAGTPVSGAIVEMRYVSGVALSPTVVTTRSRDNGSFDVSAAASALGESTVSITVAHEGEPPYVVPNFRIESTRIDGDATVLPPWVSSRPGIPIALVVLDPQGNQIRDTVRMEFQRSSGPRMFSAADGQPVDVVSGFTPGEYVFLFNGVFTDAVGDVFGTLFIHYGTVDLAIAEKFSATPVFHLQHQLIAIAGR